MKSDTRFWNKIAPKYAKTPIADEAAYQHKLERTRSYFTPDATVLEIGCGTGSTALLHAPFVKEILATDFADEMLDIARSKAEAEGITNVRFEHMNADAIDGSFDVVMAMSVLQLVPNRAEVIERIFRVLKPGGHFISSTTCLMDEMWYLLPVLPLGRIIGQIPYVAFFTADTLRKNLETAGFEIVEDWQPAPKKALFLVAKKPG